MMQHGRLSGQTHFSSQVFSSKNMSSDKDKKGLIKKNWASSSDASKKTRLFTDDEITLHVNKTTNETFFYYDKKIDLDIIERLEYDPEAFTVDVVRKDDQVWDLGVKVQYFIRPYLSKTDKVEFVRTYNRERIEAKFVPIVHKQKKSKH